MLNCLKFKSLYSLISKAKDNKLFVLDPKTKVNAERVSSSPQSLARQVWGRGPAGPRRPRVRAARGLPLPSRARSTATAAAGPAAPGRTASGTPRRSSGPPGGRSP